MTSLILCIACSSLLVFMFRVFEHFGIEPFPAIVFNYLTCVACGLINMDNRLSTEIRAVIFSPWLWLAVVLGIAFINIFVLTSRTALKFGVSTASLAMKLGLVVPVIFAFSFYHEAASANKIAGILCAFAAVFLSSLIKESASGVQARTGISFLLPLVVFAGSGLCDSGAQLADKFYFSGRASGLFVLAVFFFAAATGMIYLIAMLIRKKVSLRWQQVVGGIALGLPNYGSLLFLLRALGQAPGGSAVVFPVVNMATVAGSTLLSVFIFGEELNRYKRAALLFAALCILFIYWPFQKIHL